MKNAFDAQANLNEWIQNDWESDDFIENSRGNSGKSNSGTNSAEAKPNAGHYLLAILYLLAVNPLVWIGIVAAILILS